MILTNDVKDYCLKRRTAFAATAAKEQPRLAVLQAGEAGTAEIMKWKTACEQIGIYFEWYYFEEDITDEELMQEIKDLEEFVDGIVVKMPSMSREIRTAIGLKKDVDGANPFGRHHSSMISGIMQYLAHAGFVFEGAHVVIFDKSEDFGEPLGIKMGRLGATVSLCDESTRNRWDFIETADLIITTMGLNCYAIHVPVIDVAGKCINTENRKVIGTREVKELSVIGLMDNLMVATNLREVDLN